VTAPDLLSAVLVPVDGSELSHRALPTATILAERCHAGIVVMTAVPSADEVAEGDDELADVRLPVGAAPNRRMVVVDGDVPRAIHEALRQLGPAIACMATHGRGRAAAVLGSVAAETLARGRDPMVLVGPFVGDGPRPESEASGVLACVDDTPAAALVAAEAFSWAALLGEQLVIATAAEPVPTPVRPGPVHRRFGPDGDVEEYLATVAEPFAYEGVDVLTEVMWDPVSPADAVRMRLEERPAVLAVAGTRARTGLARLLFGSVAASIVLHGRSPIMVVPISDVG
jgi:nucleotide-binding universal stress UspA family protein